MVDVPVPQRVDQSAEVVKFFVALPVVAEQVIEVPTIILGDTIPQRAPLRAPQLAEQLVEVPLPAWMRLAVGTDVEAVHGGPLVSGGLQTHPVDPPRGLHSPGRHIGRLCDPAAQVPAVLRRVRGCASASILRQSGGYYSCFTETGLTVQTVQKTGDSMVQLDGCRHAHWCANDRAMVQTVVKTVVFRRCSTLTGWSMSVAVHRRFGRP